VGFDAALAQGVHDNVPGNVRFDFEYGDEARHRSRSRGPTMWCA
jgi:hypothetical protein